LDKYFLFHLLINFCSRKGRIIRKTALDPDPQPSKMLDQIRFFALKSLLKPLTKIIALFRQRVSWVAAILLALYNMQQDGRPSNQVREHY
jgi:hypothetical protein